MADSVSQPSLSDEMSEVGLIASPPPAMRQMSVAPIAHAGPVLPIPLPTPSPQWQERRAPVVERGLPPMPLHDPQAEIIIEPYIVPQSIRPAPIIEPVAAIRREMPGAYVEKPKPAAQPKRHDTHRSRGQEPARPVRRAASADHGASTRPARPPRAGHATDRRASRSASISASEADIRHWLRFGGHSPLPAPPPFPAVLEAAVARGKAAGLDAQW